MGRRLRPSFWRRVVGTGNQRVYLFIVGYRRRRRRRRLGHGRRCKRRIGHGRRGIREFIDSQCFGNDAH
jgi:hypothetical protein